MINPHDEIMSVENIMTAEECQKAIDQIENLIAHGFYHESPTDIDRRDECIYMSCVDASSFDYTSAISKRIMGAPFEEYVKRFPLLDFRTLAITDMKGQKTPAGGGFHNWHCENWNANSAHRYLTYTIYLNDDFDGGETEFLHQNMRVVPKAGMLSLFPCTFLHTHRGNPPIGGTKYILTGWVIDVDPHDIRNKIKDLK